MTSAEQLHAGIAALKLGLPAAAEQQLLAYMALLAKWNRTYNLTAVRDETAMVGQHLLDSLTVLPHLGDIATLADVGSGGGLPGLPLAIALPELEVALIESSQKKASFLKQVKIELKLANVNIYCDRVEAVFPQRPFDAVISRAFSELAEFVGLAGHLLAKGRNLLAMKGVYPEQEISRLPVGWKMVQSIPLIVPGLDAQRNLIVIEKTE